MSKSQVPRGATKKDRCKKCGVSFYGRIIDNSLRVKQMCDVCEPPKTKDNKKEVQSK